MDGQITGSVSTISVPSPAISIPRRLVVHTARPVSHVAKNSDTQGRGRGRRRWGTVCTVGIVRTPLSGYKRDKDVRDHQRKLLESLGKLECDVAGSGLAKTVDGLGDLPCGQGRGKGQGGGLTMT